MEIKKMQASFGELQGESLKLHDGLNIIESPDGSGKSSWCAFTQAMLYGAESSKDYLPPSGAPMEGSMELISNHCNISISRSTRVKSAPMREFTAVYTGSNERVQELNSDNSGSELSGLSSDAFRRCAFIPRDKEAEENRELMRQRIENILSSGEAVCSYDEAQALTDSWQQSRRNDKKGLLPELEEKISQHEQSLKALESSSAEMEKLGIQLSEARQQCSELEIAVTDSRKYQRRESLNRLSSGRTELKEKSEAHDKAMTELSLRREELRQSRFGDRSLQQLTDEVNKDVAELKASQGGKNGFLVMLPALICFVLAIGLAAIYAKNSAVILIILSAVLCIAAVILFLRYAKIRQEKLKAEELQHSIFKKYKAEDTEGIYAALRLHTQLCKAAEEAGLIEEESRKAYENARDRQTELESRTLGELNFSDGSSAAARLSRELAEARERAEDISSRLSSLKSSISSMGEPLIIESELSCLKAQHKLISEEYEAMTLVSKLLSEADEEMRRDISPEIAKLAAKYMSSVTDSRYEEALVKGSLSTDAPEKDIELLSDGTLTLLYFALRLAVSRLSMNPDEPCPLIIDDALRAFSPESYAQAMELLKRVSAKRQVILFSGR